MDIDLNFEYLSKPLTISVVCNFSLFLLINFNFMICLRQNNWQGRKVAIKSLFYITSCESFLEVKS